MSSYLINEFIYSNYWLIFLLIYLLRIILVWEGGDWLIIWIGIEINIIRFIVIIYKERNIEICLKYFLIQSLGSSLILGVRFINLKFIEDIFILILRYKIGVGPFYFWFPSLREGLGWVRIYFLITLQKIIPLIIICHIVGVMFWLVLGITLFGGVYGAIGERCLKRLIAFSSIYHVGWIMLGGGVGWNLLEVYFIGYFIILGGVVIVLYINEVTKRVSLLFNKWIFVMGILRFGGIPPFLGFFLKWWVFKHLLEFRIGILILLVLLSVLIFYLYFRVLYVVIIEGFIFGRWNTNIRTSNVGYEIGFIGAVLFSPLLIIMI